jgi:hypothetical protein
MAQRRVSRGYRLLLRGAVLALALAMGGCAGGYATRDAGVSAIRYAAGPCFGACPQFEYRIGANGEAWFDGQRFTRVTGRQPAPGGLDTFQRLARILDAVRPDTGERVIGARHCRRFVTDQPSLTVVWEEAAGERRLVYNTGCRDVRYQSLLNTLHQARQALPVDDLIGTR